MAQAAAALHRASAAAAGLSALQAASQHPAFDKADVQQHLCVWHQLTQLDAESRRCGPGRHHSFLPASGVQGPLKLESYTLNAAWQAAFLHRMGPHCI